MSCAPRHERDFSFGGFRVSKLKLKRFHVSGVTTAQLHALPLAFLRYLESRFRSNVGGLSGWGSLEFSRGASF